MRTLAERSKPANIYLRFLTVIDLTLSNDDEEAQHPDLEQHAPTKPSTISNDSTCNAEALPPSSIVSSTHKEKVLDHVVNTNMDTEIGSPIHDGYTSSQQTATNRSPARATPSRIPTYADIVSGDSRNKQYTPVQLSNPSSPPDNDTEVAVIEPETPHASGSYTLFRKSPPYSKQPEIWTKDRLRSGSHSSSAPSPIKCRGRARQPGTACDECRKKKRKCLH